MLTAMVSGYYEPNGNEIYPPGTEAYGEYCYGVQDICTQMPCAYHGHPGVRMVSNNSSGPVPLPLQMPGHLVQQVVDENGTVRHIFISPPMPLTVGGPHYSPSHASSAPLATAPYYAYPQPPYAAPPHFHPQPPSHLQSPLGHQNMHGMIQHPTQCNGQSTHQGSENILYVNEGPSSPLNQFVPAQKDDRYPRQTFKFRRKIDSNSKDSKYVILPNQSSTLSSKKDRRKMKGKCEDIFRINGSSGSNTSEVSDDEYTWVVSEYLSSMRPPTVTELSSRSVIASWKPPENPSSEVEKKLCLNIEESEISYDVMLCEKGKDGHYKSVYSGSDHYCNITSLKPSTEYYVSVQASLDDVRGSTVKSPVFKTLCSDTEAPQPPRLCARTKNSLILKWNNTTESSSKIRSFILEYDEGYGGNNFVSVYSGPLKQYKIIKLSPATCYRFRLAVITEKTKSPYSAICSFYTCSNAPSQPLPPVLKQAFLNRLQLEWEKRPVDDDFCLQIEDEHARQGFLTAYSGRDTSFTCCGLKGNTEYKFRLCASNEEGSSPWSKIVTYCTLPDKLSCPGKPIPKGRIHASCFRVTWDPPKDCKQSSITKYILEVDRGYGFEAVYTGPETEFFLENLLPGTMYKVRVACISAVGHSPYSEANSITTAAVNPGKCAPPKLQSKPEASFLCLEWAHPEYDGGSAICEYEVDMTGPDNITTQAYKGSETSCIVNGLSPGRPYLFQVRAYNRVGAGPLSDPLEVVSGAGPPDAPQNFAAQCNSPHSCFLSWEEPVNNGATVTSYQLQWNTEDSSDDDDSFHELFEGLSRSYEAHGLTPATKYSFRIRAVNDAGPGVNSDIVSCKTPASCPGVISSVNVAATSNSFYLSWSEPSQNGSPIISYNVELDSCIYNTEGSVPEMYLEGLTPETVHRIRVQAVNSIGEGPFSEPIEAATLKSPPDPPQLECVIVGHNSLRLRWGEGRKADSICYTLEMSQKLKSFVPIYHGTGLSHKVSRLQENTSYRFRICASSESGQGLYSDIYTFQTNVAPPAALKAPRVCNITETSCLVEWSAIKHLPGQFFSYQLQLSSNCGQDSKIVYQGNDAKHTIADLEPHTTYTVRVAAVRHHESEDLIGVYSPSTAFTTLNIDTIPRTVTLIPQSLSTVERRTLRDRHLAAVLVSGFVLISFLTAVVLENVFCLSSPT